METKALYLLRREKAVKLIVFKLKHLMKQVICLSAGVLELGSQIWPWRISRKKRQRKKDTLMRLKKQAQSCPRYIPEPHDPNLERQTDR